MLQPNLPERFPKTCAKFYAGNPLDAIPGARIHFHNEEQVVHMSNAMMPIILRPARDPALLRHQLHQLGKRHRERGILRIQLKVGREAFLSAVDHAAPDLSASERNFFEKAYDELASEMMAAIMPTERDSSPDDN